MTCLHALHNCMCCCTACHDVQRHNSKTTHSVTWQATTSHNPLHHLRQYAHSTVTDKLSCVHLHRFRAPANSNPPAVNHTCQHVCWASKAPWTGPGWCPADHARACGQHQPAKVEKQLLSSLAYTQSPVATVRDSVEWCVFGLATHIPSVLCAVCKQDN